MLNTENTMRQSKPVPVPQWSVSILVKYCIYENINFVILYSVRNSITRAINKGSVAYSHGVWRSQLVLKKCCCGKAVFFTSAKNSAPVEWQEGRQVTLSC